MLNFLIKNEFYILDNIKFFLSRTNKNYSIKELLNYIANDDTIELKEQDKAYRIKRIIENKKDIFLALFNFFEKLDNLKSIKEKIKFIDYIKNQIDLIKQVIIPDKFYFIPEIKNDLDDLENEKIDKEIKEAFIQFLSESDSYLQVINFNSNFWPKAKKFYFELDFSLPEDVVIEQIKTLYKEYKKGNIKNFEEFVLNKQIKKFNKLDELTNNLIFKLKNEKKIPLYVKLTDIIYILDMWLINMKNVFVIRQIENNRIRYDNTLKEFESTYKQYKKFIVNFYKNKEYKHYI